MASCMFLRMADEFALVDLFDRWEQVWHEGKFDLVARCVGNHYTRHDESGDRTVTREAYAAEIAKIRQERPTSGLSSMIIYSRTTGRGFALPLSGPIPKQA